MDMEVLTVAQTAKYLQLSEKTVRRMIGTGSLQASKLNNRTWRIRTCDIDSYLSSTSNSQLEVELFAANEPVDKSVMTDASQKSKTIKNGPKQISLFSGCGGLDLGFKKAGFDIVWANDFDSDAQSVYALNIGEIDKRDILTVNEDEIPDGDILTAGFPCQPFSNAGNRKGVHDSRGMLYKECLRIIAKRCPRLLFLKMLRDYFPPNILTDAI